MANNTAAVVVTYNRKALLKKCIGKLLESLTPCDILIIDNASTDGTKEMLNEMLKAVEKDRVFYYNTGANLGGAGGFNYGIKQAVQNGYDYVWIMDDDCMVSKDSLTELSNADKKLKGDYGYLSSLVIWRDGNLCNMNIQKQSLTKRIENIHDGLIPIEMASFVSVFFRAEIIKEVGLPIKEFFIWADDLEYTARISKKYKCYSVGKSRVLHDTAANTGSNISVDTKERLERYRYSYRNEVYLYRRKGLYGIGYWLFRLAYHLLRVAIKSKDLKLLRCKIIIGSTIKGLFFNPTIEYIKRG